MGKEWLYNWGGGRGGGGSGGGGSSSGSRSRKRGVNKTFSCSSEADSGIVVSNSTPSGCINAVIQLFDFHPFHFSSNLHHQSHDHTTFLPHEPTTNVPLKGLPSSSLQHTHTHTLFYMHYTYTHGVSHNACIIKCF